MPFPIGHGLVGATLYAATQRELSFAKDWRILLLCAALAILPDLDFVFGWAFGLEGWHRGFTHSIAFGLMGGLLAAKIARVQDLRKTLGIAFAAVSNGLLDTTAADMNEAGVKLFWPVADYPFRLDVIDYFKFRFDPRFDPWGDIVVYALKVSVVELAVFGPILIIILLVKQKERNSID